MKPYISENPKNCRVSTYLTAEEVADLAKIVGDQSVASWLRELILQQIKNEDALKPFRPKPSCMYRTTPLSRPNCDEVDR